VNPAGAFNFRVFLFPTKTPANLDAASSAQATISAQATTIDHNPSLVVGFAEVNGLSSELEVEEYREGGRNAAPHRFLKWGRFPNLVCRRGVTRDTRLWTWYNDTQLGSGPRERWNGVIVVEDTQHKSVAGWFFANALPERLVGPTLNARASEVAIETLEMSHEGLFRLKDTELP
jgi:phage tail-like protein